jgi:ElaB/YqjD/DUF883 family membrane-anchored ribosome-binding protein
MSEDKFSKAGAKKDGDEPQQKASSKPLAAKPASAKRDDEDAAPKRPVLPAKREVQPSSAAGAGLAGILGGLATEMIAKANEAAKEAASIVPPEVAQEVTDKVTALRGEYTDLLSRANLTDTNQQIASLTNDLAKLPAEIEQIRKRGYAFRSYLESKASILTQQWDEIRGQIQATIQQESAELSQPLKQVEGLIRNIESMAGNILGQQRVLPMMESAMTMLTEKIDAAEELISSLWEPIQQELSTTQSQLNEIKGYLDFKDEASFPFLAAESVYLVAEAEWKANDDPNGLVYLTDQRIIFEQKETKGKKLGLFGGKEVQQVLWEAPINLVEEVKPESKGLFGGKDLLHFTFKSGAPYGNITIEVMGGDAKDWAKRFKQVFTGEAQGDRAIQPDPELIERLRSAPTACPVCGGMLPQIVAGQTEIKCQYCGATIRL